MENVHNVVPNTVKLNVLTEVCSFVNSDMSREQQLQAIVEAANKVIGSENSALITYNEKANLLYYHLVIGEHTHELKKLSIKPGGIASWVVEHGTPMIVPDVALEPRYSHIVHDKLRSNIRSVLCVPLRSREKVVGAFEVMNRIDGRPFGENDLPLVNAFASLIGIVLSNSELRHSTNQQTTELEDLAHSKSQEADTAKKSLQIKTQRLAITTKMISMINSNQNLNETLIEVAVQLRKLLTFDYMTIALILDDKRSVRLLEVYPSSSSHGSEVIKIPLDDPVIAYAVKYKRSLFHNRQRWYHCFLEEGRFLNEPLNTMLCNPIMTADALVLGTLNIGSLTEQTYPKESVNIVTFMAKQIGIAFERQNMRKTLERLNKELQDKTVELRKNIITMGDANLKLFEAQQELWDKDKRMQVLLTEVQEKNEELNTTLLELKQTQSQLVQSEKMASLGQLVAGIAHELNTPAGAIKASSEVIPDYLRKTILYHERLIDAGITPEHRQTLQTLLDHMIEQAKQQHRKSTSEMRAQSKQLEQALQQDNIKDVRSMAKDIARCYLEDDIDALRDLFQHYEPEHIMDFITYCSRMLVSSRDNQISVGMISKIVRALKSYSYQDQSKERKVDLNEDLENTLTILHSQIPKNITIVKSFGELPQIACLGSELNQVWTNLLQNALQSLEDGGGTITIESLATPTDVIVKISDDGPGIPQDIQDKIFDPFFTTRRGRSSGLGLSVTLQVVEKHRGTIKVRSIPGKTTFEVILPQKGLETS